MQIVLACVLLHESSIIDIMTWLCFKTLTNVKTTRASTEHAKTVSTISPASVSLGGRVDTAI